MNILGIDPGYNRVGFAILKKTGGVFDILEAGFIETLASADFQDRILEIGKRIEGFIKKYSPEVIAVEKLFFTTNQKTALKVAEVKGIVMYLAAINSIRAKEFTPLEVKCSICGYGKADKKQIRDMLKFSFKNKELPKNDDACDAIALALTAFFAEKNVYKK